MARFYDILALFPHRIVIICTIARGDERWHTIWGNMGHKVHVKQAAFFGGGGG